MTAIAMPRHFNTFAERATSAEKAAKKASIRMDSLTWGIFLPTLPHLYLLAMAHEELNKELALCFSPTSASELKSVAKKLEYTHKKMEYLLKAYGDNGLSSRWLYSSVIHRLVDQADYLSSIIEGFQLSLDSDFCDAVRDTVADMRAATEHPSCRVVN